jgi:hypothetical protein
MNEKKAESKRKSSSRSSSPTTQEPSTGAAQPNQPPAEKLEETTKELLGGFPAVALLDVIRGGAVCLFPGRRKRRIGEDTVSFRDCLPFVGPCDVLIFCELNRSFPQTRDYLRQQLGTPRDGITIKVDAPDDLELPVPEAAHLFPRLVNRRPEWVPAETQPAKGKFWAHWSVLRVEGGQRETLHLLHLGIGEQAVWLYFLNSHQIEVAKIITDPRYAHVI